MLIRPARPDEGPCLTALSWRSKAVWGYDAAFMAACLPDLTLTPADLAATDVADTGRAAGLVQIALSGQTADLVRLFIDPPEMRKGHGTALLAHAVTRARTMGATRLRIEADPAAEGFYLFHGAQRVGTAPSPAIPGRRLPVLHLPLQPGKRW